MRVAPAVARLGPEYRPALFEHLLSRKLRHWERATRELAARALAELAGVDAPHAAGPVLDALMPLCRDPLLEVDALCQLIHHVSSAQGFACEDCSTLRYA